MKPKQNWEEGLIRRREVARLAGVSEATVSRVLNGVGPVKEDTRERVLAAARQLNYVPSALAQRFARSKSGNLGVILPLLPKVNLFSTYYFSEILSGIGVTAKERGYDLLLLFRKPDESRDYANLFRTQKVDGCIILGAQDVPGERAALAELQEGNYPFCLVNQRFDG
ncbi:LacI family transcriptional regulator, partial [Paenibacillus sepulcri]|nr:LacI family transcriptional regulator [Paenibacillus sepulcri]